MDEQIIGDMHSVMRSVGCAARNALEGRLKDFRIDIEHIRFWADEILKRLDEKEAA